MAQGSTVRSNTRDMTTPNKVVDSIASSVQALDDTAHGLYKRSRAAGLDFSDLTQSVRSLGSALNHLQEEVADSESLVNGKQGETSIYARQLAPLLEDCSFNLQHVGTLLTKYAEPDHVNTIDDAERGTANGDKRLRSGSSILIGDRERSMMHTVQMKLDEQATSIEMFLDTVQLQAPENVQNLPDLEHTDSRTLEKIKDKVDAIAERVFQGRDSVDRGSEEQMWHLFWAGLVSEGFSADVLKKNKEVLRAYIRELENGMSDSQHPPSVRGLLDQKPHSSHAGTPPSLAVIPASLPRADEALSPKEMLSPRMDNEKFMPSVKQERRQPDQRPRGASDLSQQGYTAQELQQFQPQMPGLSSHNTGLSYDRYTSESDVEDGNPSQALALISTRDLMALDRRGSQDLSARMRSLQLGPSLQPGVLANYSTSPTSPTGKYLPAPIPIPTSSVPEHQLSSSPHSQDLSVSPRYIPPLPPYASPASSQLTNTPPPAYGTSPTASNVPLSAVATAQRVSQLAPDSRGQNIPMDAKWTRIKRSLVSPEVLEKAGVRYEARPEFVAILGVFTKDQINDFAKKSAAARAARGRGSSESGRPSGNSNTAKYRPSSNERRRRVPSPSGSETDTSDDIFDSDSSDDEEPRSTKRGQDRYTPVNGRRESDVDGKSSRAVPVIVQAPSTNKNSPTSATMPKPILKNRNENHVRFEENGPREVSEAELSRERERKSRSSRRDRESRYHGSDNRRSDRDRDRHREYHPSNGHRPRHRSDAGERREHRHRGEGERPLDDAREKRKQKKSVWGETLGAVGIGGAAVSLLTVLTEAASQM